MSLPYTMARILELLQRSVQLTLEIDAVKLHFADLLSRVSSSPAIHSDADNLLSGDISALDSTSLEKAVEVLCRRIAESSQGHRCGSTMDNCLADARCPMKLFNSRSSLSPLTIATDNNSFGAPTMKSEEQQTMSTEDINADRLVFRRPGRTLSSLNLPEVAVVSKVAYSRLPPTADPGRRMTSHGRRRADGNRNALDSNDDGEADKENTLPSMVVSWLPPTGLKHPAQLKTSAELFKCGTEPNDLISSVQRHSDVINYNMADKRSNDIDPASEESGIGHNEVCEDANFPSSLENISVISRGGCVSASGSTDEVSSSEVVVSGHLDRSSRLSPTCPQLRRSSSTLNGAFCSSFNADEPAFCSTFCYPLHSTVVGVDVSDLDISALVAEQLRHHQQQQRQRSRDSSTVDRSCRHFDSRISNSTPTTTTELQRRDRFDDIISHRDDLGSSADGSPENLLCTECGYFHARATGTGCCSIMAAHVGCDRANSSTSSSKRRRRHCDEHSAGSDRPGSKQLKSCEPNAPKESVDVEQEDWNSSSDDANRTAGNLRRQMGQTKLYAADDNDADNRFRLSTCSNADSFPDVTCSSSLSAAPLDRGNASATSSGCFCRRIGLLCMLCRRNAKLEALCRRDVTGSAAVDCQNVSPMFPGRGDEVKDEKNTTNERTTAVWNSMNTATSVWSMTGTLSNHRGCYFDNRTLLSTRCTLPPPSGQAANRILTDDGHQSASDASPSNDRAALGPTSSAVSQQSSTVEPQVKVTRRNCQYPFHRRRKRHSQRKPHHSDLAPVNQRRAEEGIGSVFDDGVSGETCGASGQKYGCRTSADVESSVSGRRLISRHHHYRNDRRRNTVDHCSVPHSTLPADAASSWSASTTSRRVHQPASLSTCTRADDVSNMSDTASRLRKRALVMKLRRFSDALYGTAAAGGLQLKIFGQV